MSVMSFGQASFTKTYDFTSVTTTSGTTDPTPVPTEPGLTFGSFSAATTSTNSSAGFRFSFANQPLGATNGNDATFTGAIDLNTYYQVTISPNAGTTYNLDGITFGMRRSGTGVRHYAVRSSLDNYATNLPASINPSNANLTVAGDVFFWAFDATSTAADQTGSTITLSSAFDGLTVPVTFRFYAWDAEAAGGNFSIDNVAISGATTTLNVAQNNIDGLKVYPNPAKNTLYITSDSFATKEVELFDVLGKSVLNTKVINNTVNISSLSKGVYVVKITEEGKTATRKIVVE